MPSPYTVDVGERGAYGNTLTAGTTDVVTFTRDLARVRVINIDGADAIYITLDGTDPTVGDPATYELPGFAGAVLELPVPQQSTSHVDLVVKLKSAGTPKYSCSVAY